MSNWTHVAAIFRVDSFLHEGKDFTKIFGKELDYYDSTEKWNEASDYPEHFLPLGSEGSLQMSVWEIQIKAVWMHSQLVYLET